MQHIRVIGWNIRSCSDDKLSLHIPWEHDEAFKGSIMFLCETRRVDDISNWFAGYTVFQRPAQRKVAGEGLLMAVPKQALYLPELVECSDDVIAVLLQDAARKPLAVVLGVYMPPAQSQRLEGEFPSLAERYALLHDIIARHPNVPVVIVGDFNCEHAVTDRTAHAQALRAFLHESSLSVCTGMQQVDLDYMHDPASSPLPTYHRQGHRSRRLDHVLACPNMLEATIITKVLPDPHHFSDHLPVFASFTVAVSTTTTPTIPCSARPPRLVWRMARKDAYVAVLKRNCHAANTQMSELLTRGDVDGALSCLVQLVHHAATSVGMRRSSRTRRTTLPYITLELLQLRRDYWRAFRAGNYELYQQLRCQHQHGMRFRKRVWLRHRSRQVFAQLKHDSHHVYKTYRGTRSCLPESLQHPSSWQLFLTSLASPKAPAPTQHLHTHSVSTNLVHAASALNSPFTQQEVLQAVKRLNNNRSPGFGGLCSEFFRYAVYVPVDADGRKQEPVNVLAECITVLVNAVFAQGTVPSQWDLSLITPVHKRGSTLDTANYRPIAVGEPLAKLYAVLLQLRLDAYLEKHSLRSDSQAGFRTNRSTSDQLFLLQHFIDKHKHARQSLYACYVDLKSAYDLVSRPVLWWCVQRKGVHGTFLRALQSLYASPRYAICVGGLVGPSVLSTIGVRQGCPLSPLLFGLMLDDLTQHLLKGLHHAPCLEAYTHQSGSNVIHYPRCAVPNMEFADDILLLSTSLNGMQGLLTSLRLFCSRMGMLVNVSKTLLVQLVQGRPLRGDISLPLTYGDQQLPYHVSGTKYLGLIVNPSVGLRNAPSDLCQRAHRAFLAFRRRLPNLQCELNIALLVRMYWTIVRPVLLYGAEVWAVLPSGEGQRRQLYALFFRHLTTLCHLPRSVSRDALCLALNIIPLNWEAPLRSVRFWHRLWQLPDGAFLRHVVLDNWKDACMHGVKNFAHGLRAYLLKIDCIQNPPSLPLPPTLSMDSVLHTLQQRQASLIASFPVHPLSAPSDGAILCTYARYYHILPYEPLTPLFHLPLSAKACGILLRFMLGHSHLPLHAGRYNGVPRSERYCTLCRHDVVADEHHMLFECDALQSLRVDRSALFHKFTMPNTKVVQHFMRHSNRFAVAGFILQALRRYKLATITPP
jgi:exonuclease III